MRAAMAELISPIDPARNSDILSFPFPQKAREWMGHGAISENASSVLSLKFFEELCADKFRFFDSPPPN
jgi:hypothetical protein